MAGNAPKALNNKEESMAHDAPQASGPSKLVIRNIGLLLSGSLENPILDADTIVAVNGKITAIGAAGISGGRSLFEIPTACSLQIGLFERSKIR